MNNNVSEKYQNVKFIHKLIPVLFFVVFVVFSFMVGPTFFGVKRLAVEVVMSISAIIISLYLVIFVKLKWSDLQDAIVQRISAAIPALVLFLCIGLLISSLIVSGTVPMLIYYGVKIINPQFLYVIAFLLTILFSISTGTSWGSVATIGVVLMSVADTVGVNLAITAAAVIGGAYFGDKLSPLSDTTNLAALASETDLFSHIKSMFWTTIPTAIVSIIFYTVCGFVNGPDTVNVNEESINAILNALNDVFNFNPLLLIPILIVLIGSYKKKPIIPVMILGALAGYICAILFQEFSLASLLASVGTGFSATMVDWVTIEGPGKEVITFLQRGGFWTFGRLIAVIMSTLIAVSSLSVVDAIKDVTSRLFAFAKTRFTVVTSSVFAAGIILALASNGIACTFVTADIFKEKYDKLKIPRHVLSRSIEDAGTMINPLYSWTPAGIYMVATLGVSVADFAPWAIMNYGTIVVAVILALFNIGIYDKKSEIK